MKNVNNSGETLAPHRGTSGRMARRAFVQALGCTLAFPAVLRVSAAPDDSDLLAQARAQIQQQRKGSGTILIRGAGGKPVPGATVQFEQTRHEFLFGSNFFMYDQFGSAEQNDAYTRRFRDLLNYATLGFYWTGYEPTKGRPKYQDTTKALDWCARNGVTGKGHPLVWDHPASAPRWLPESIEEVQRAAQQRVTDCIQRFQKGINIWDVVNEATDLSRFKNPLNTWASSLGSSRYTKSNLKVARAANAKATLLVNDYVTDASYYRLLDDVREEGKLLFDAVGIQSHMHDGLWPLNRIWSVCNRFAEFKVPVHFTETSVVSGVRLGPGEHWAATTAQGEARQAEYVPKLYTMLFAHPAVRAVTWWDLADAGAWQGAAAGLLRKDLSPKPAFERLKELVKREWWTRESGTSDAAGEFRSSGFFGDYKVSVRLADGKTLSRDLSWKRDGTRNFEITIN